jgi:hypothetical protein
MEELVRQAEERHLSILEERDAAVITALGSHAHPGLSSGECVALVVANLHALGDERAALEAENARLREVRALAEFEYAAYDRDEQALAQIAKCARQALLPIAASRTESKEGR